MVKLEDPTIPYADLIARRRRERAAIDGQAFRLGAPGYDWREAYPERGTRVVIAASDQALRAAQAEDTSRVIGMVGGLLVDMGFQVFPAKALSGDDLDPSLLVWAGGDATTPEERDQLRTIGSPGVTVGPCPSGVDGWTHVEVDDIEDWRGFVRRFVPAIAALVEIPEAAYMSNNLSNEPRRTGPDDAGRATVDKAADLHQHGRRRTRPDRPNRDSGGS